MAYADYAFYTEDFKGCKLKAEEFNYYAERASDILDSATYGRSRTYADLDNVIKNACCAVAETLLKYDNGGGVASETVGKHTVNYVAGISTTKTEEQALNVAVRRYLGSTGLLYAGV